MELRKAKAFAGATGPVVLVVMDGVGVGAAEEGDMVRAAHTPTLDWLRKNALYTEFKAHGTAVGLPSDDDMGNSEVGHNALGAGRVFEQGAALVNASIATRALYDGQVWQDLVANVLERDSALHFIGLFSDGNVHSHLDHLKAMLVEARERGVRRACIHILLDGRDVPPTSALEYVDEFEAFLADMNRDGAAHYAIASGGGRMWITMDRYNADWSMVERGWKAHVKGEGRPFASAREAIETYRTEQPDLLDQDMLEFVITEDGKPVGPIVDGDSVILFNYRGDRAIELSRAFDEEELAEFDRGSRPDVRFAGMMQYDGDLQIPSHFLVAPPAIDRTMGEYLAGAGVTQYAVSETQKYGHVTYFYNGNRSRKFSDELEEYVEVPSDKVPFEERPWMKGAEITDAAVEAIASGKYRYVRLNYPNGDMVGHTGAFQAVRIGVETVDLGLARLLEAVEQVEGILIVSADHGNSDDMYERDKKTGQVKRGDDGTPKPKTAHSLNPVPCYVYDPSGTANLRLSGHRDLGISSLAATILVCLGYTPPEQYTPSIVEAG